MDTCSTIPDQLVFTPENFDVLIYIVYDFFLLVCVSKQIYIAGIYVQFADSRYSMASERGSSVLITSEWLKQHAKLYGEATFHPFIQNIRDGSIDFNCFKRWLCQDYIFVREFVCFLASVLLKIPKDSHPEDMDIILSGLAALDQEISWFRKEALKWEVDLLNCNAQKANQDYCRFLESLMQPHVEYAVVIVALWTIEVVYCNSFAICLELNAKTPPLLLEACERWGNEGFKQYCMSLQKIADKALDNAPHDVQQKAKEAFIQVLRNEIEFWNMSYGDDMK